MTDEDCLPLLEKNENEHLDVSKQTYLTPDGRQAATRSPLSYSLPETLDARQLTKKPTIVAAGREDSTAGKLPSEVALPQEDSTLASHVGSSDGGHCSGCTCKLRGANPEPEGEAQDKATMLELLERLKQAEAGRQRAEDEVQALRKLQHESMQKLVDIIRSYEEDLIKCQEGRSARGGLAGLAASSRHSLAAPIAGHQKEPVPPVAAGVCGVRSDAGPPTPGPGASLPDGNPTVGATPDCPHDVGYSVSLTTSVSVQPPSHEQVGVPSSSIDSTQQHLAETSSCKLQESALQSDPSVNDELLPARAEQPGGCRSLGLHEQALAESQGGGIQSDHPLIDDKSYAKSTAPPAASAPPVSTAPSVSSAPPVADLVVDPIVGSVALAHPVFTQQGAAPARRTHHLTGDAGLPDFADDRSAAALPSNAGAKSMSLSLLVGYEQQLQWPTPDGPTFKAHVKLSERMVTNVKCSTFAVASDGCLVLATQKGDIRILQHDTVLEVGDIFPDGAYTCLATRSQQQLCASDSQQPSGAASLAIIAGNKTKRQVEVLVPCAASGIGPSWCIERVLLPDNLPWCLAVDPDKTLVAVGSGRNVHIVRLDGSGSRPALSVGLTVATLAFTSASLAMLVVASGEKKRCIVEGRSLADPSSTVWQHPLRRRVCGLCCDRHDNCYVLQERSSVLLVLSAARGSLLAEITCSDQPLHPVALAFDADCRWLAFLLSDKQTVALCEFSEDQDVVVARSKEASQHGLADSPADGSSSRALPAGPAEQALGAPQGSGTEMVPRCPIATSRLSATAEPFVPKQCQ